MTERLKNKVIVITGGGKGVGSAAAAVFAKEGAKVVISGRDKEAGKRTSEQIKSRGGECLFVPVDLRRVMDCENLFSVTADKFGRIDGFFAYAGVTNISPLDKCDEKTFDEILSVNFKGTFFCAKEAVRYMKKTGGGSVVLTGSAHAWGGEKDRAAYACSKGALLTLNEHIAKNYAEDNIRSNMLVLGWTATEGEIALRDSLGESEAELKKRATSILPMGIMPEATDYTEALVYLLSDASKIMTGSVFRMTAGEYI